MINTGQPDPLTNRRLSDDCWNGRHWRVRRKAGEKLVFCNGHRKGGEECECLCHEEKRLADSAKGLKTG